LDKASLPLFLLAVFGASAVEMVEALTIVLAAGVSRGFRSALEGALAAMCLLVVLVGAVGVPLVNYVPLDDLRVAVGAVLLVLGLSWLRKAILRGAGRLAHRNEDEVFRRTKDALEKTGPVPRSRDAVGFTVAFKGVFLEGVEVVVIVISLGASQHRLLDAASAALGAALVVGIAGALLARQLSSVPENLIKTVVGAMLSSFGVFWLGEGAGIAWPGSDLAIPLLVVAFGVFAWAAMGMLRLVGREGSHEAPPIPATLEEGSSL